MVLYAREGLNCMVVTVADNMVKSPCGRTKQNANIKDLIVEVYYQPPSQDNTADELFYKKLKVISRSSAFVFVGDFNFPDNNRKYHMVDTNRPRIFLKHVEEAC